jgi:exosortase/archaeosortase family protein
MVLLSAPIALIANYLRVFSILLLARYWDVDVALGFFHDWSSPFLFLMALALLITVGRGLGCYGVRLDISR